MRAVSSCLCVSICLSSCAVGHAHIPECSSTTDICEFVGDNGVEPADGVMLLQTDMKTALSRSGSVKTKEEASGAIMVSNSVGSIIASDPGPANVLRSDDPEKLETLSTVVPFFLVLGVVWSVYYLKKDLFPEKSVPYMLLAGFSFMVTSVSMHTLNKVCISFTNAPSSVTLVQMMIALVVFMALYHREVMGADKTQMLKWCVVPVCYAAMLNSSLLGYEYMSLTLVTVLRNCAPVITMIIEQFTMPPEHRPQFTLPVVAALAVIVVGAFMYGFTLESFPILGLVIIVANTLLAIADRVIQRRLLVEECKDLSLTTCMVINNSLGMIPTLILAGAQHELSIIRENTANWTDPGIIVLLIMSGLMGLGIGTFGLMCQKAMSATSFQVLQNSSKIAVIGIGIHLFGDQIGGPIRIAGVFLSLGGSACYGYARWLETQPSTLKAT